MTKSATVIEYWRENIYLSFKLFFELVLTATIVFDRVLEEVGWQFWYSGMVVFGGDDDV